MMKKSKSKLIIAIIIILVLVIAICAGAYLYLSTDLFKGNQELFFKYMAKNSEIIQKMDEDNSIEIEKNIKSGKYTTNSEITFNIESNDTQIANETVSAGNFGIKYSAKTDAPNNRKSSQATLKYSNNDLFTLKYIRNEDLYALKSDEVVNKYLALDNNNLKEFAKKLGVIDTSNIPDKIEWVDIEKLLYISGEDEKAILEKYSEVINKEIPKEKYKNQKNVKINVENKEIVTNAYSLELTGVDFAKVLINILNTLKTDDLTMSIMIDKIKLLNSEMEVSTQEVLEEVRQKIQNVIDNLQEIIDNQSMQEEILKITVYENNGELIRTEFATKDNKIFIDYEQNDNSSRMIVSFDMKNNSIKDSNYRDIDAINEKDTNNSSNIQLNDLTPQMQMTATMNNIDKRTLNTNEISSIGNRITNMFNLSKIEIAKQTQNGENTEFVIFTFGTGEDALKISAQNKRTVGQNIQDNTIINVNMNDYTYITAKVNTTIEPVNDIQIEELTKENSATINNFSKEYIENLSESIVKRLQTLFTKKMEQIGKPLTNIGGITQQPAQQTDAMDIQVFNSKFMPYEGKEVSGSNVKTLINLVNSNNITYASDTSKVVNVSIPNQTGETITTTTPDDTYISTSDKYTVTCEKDANSGYVNKIIITKNSNMTIQ